MHDVYDILDGLRNDLDRLLNQLDPNTVELAHYDWAKRRINRIISKYGEDVMRLPALVVERKEVWIKTKAEWRAEDLREERKAKREKTGVQMCDNCEASGGVLVEYSGESYHEHLLCEQCLGEAKSKEVKGDNK